MDQIINIVQMVSAVIMVILILIQQRGGGLSGALGGADSTSYSSRRGVEKHILRGTVVLAIIFLGSAVLQFIL